MNVKEIVRKMTLEEKAGLCSGADFWRTKAVERLEVPQMMVSDGPHGLRKQEETADHLGLDESVKAVCFPAGCATAASFDRKLLRTLGETLGKECQAEGIGVLLGPAVNIKRSPLCGRNFEYFSEDPYLAGQMASSYVKGVQSKGVGTSIKHFLANNQEHRRMSSSSEADERTLREIYMPAFEEAVKKAKPWTVMCSYNRINGVYAAQNKKYLTDVLRGEWGFDGFVVSDWGAVNDRAADLDAGLDLEMPSSFGINDKKIVEAVEKGELSEEVLDKAVERILSIVDRSVENRKEGTTYDKEEDHRLARRIAAESMVLLKNDGVLPLRKGARIAFIGEFAEKPRFQGGGSSHINTFKTESAWEMADRSHVIYAQGYSIKQNKLDDTLLSEAIRAAALAETAVVFAGLPDAFESEGFDRTHMRLPEYQNELIEAICKANPNTVVVLHNGSPVEMPWIHKVKGVLETYLGGQAVGGAVVDVLYGDVNPSGRLPETLPLKLEDNPSYIFYIGEGDKVEYREGVFVGYRYYDKKKMEVLFPFGHGLSYTSFQFSNLKLSKKRMDDTEELQVTVEVKNTGRCAGKEVVQLYVAAPEDGDVIRPVRELKGFEKVELAPGERKTVSFRLGKRAFAYYDAEISDFRVPTGEYRIEIGKSSRDICLSEEVTVRDTSGKWQPITMDTTIGDIMKLSGAKEIVEEMIERMGIADSGNDGNLGEGTADMAEAMLRYMPLRSALSFSGGEVTLEQVEEILDRLNKLQN
ncbi:MAG: glycoside hydrolase family 3 C-terminal domain-containing protein [Lachnospiraceae bacterium]|nr:glycoside hydrolase family 3 C-terminal domain-containing protein [Lachnospiraceae bacterium]